MNAATAPSKPKNFATPVCWLSYAIATTSESPTAVAQVTRDNIESEERGRLQQLLDEYGQNKSLPAGFELQALLTLSHYPELKTVNPCFLITDVNIPLSSRQNGLACSRVP